MQTSYERVKRALYFQKPDRLPARFSAFGHDDFHGVGWKQIATGDPRQPTSVDEWGCTWSRTEVKNMGLVTKHPLEDWDSLEDFKWLDPDDEALYADMDWQFEGSEGKYVYTSIFGLLFERMHHLHGFENTLVDLFLEREKLEKTIELEDRSRALVAAQTANAASRARQQTEAAGAMLELYNALRPEVLEALAMSGMDAKALIARAFLEIGENAQRIGNLNVSPDLLEALTGK